jgi:hypothetical protein
MAVGGCMECLSQPVALGESEMHPFWMPLAAPYRAYVRKVHGALTSFGPGPWICWVACRECWPRLDAARAGVLCAVREHTPQQSRGAGWPGLQWDPLRMFRSKYHHQHASCSAPPSTSAIQLSQSSHASSDKLGSLWSED